MSNATAAQLSNPLPAIVITVTSLKPVWLSEEAQGWHVDGTAKSVSGIEKWGAVVDDVGDPLTSRWVSMTKGYATETARAAKSPAKSPAILAARSIVAGDVSNARAIINAHPIYRAGFTVPEMRAIRGACALAKHKYGCDLSAFEFMW